MKAKALLLTLLTLFPIFSQSTTTDYPLLKTHQYTAFNKENFIFFIASHYFFPKKPAEPEYLKSYIDLCLSEDTQILIS